MSRGSLAYRTNAGAIWTGRVPEKYTRLLPHITGEHILEFGAAEGVLSLLLAHRNPAAKVTALELQQERHEDAVRLQARWRTLGRHVDGCTMVQGDLRERPELLNGIDTFVAIRSIYYLRESIPDVFVKVAQHCPNVVLSGNAGRARRFAQRIKDNLGPFNYFASVEGMSEVLERAGYRIGTVVKDGDPIVTGHQ